MHGGLVALSIGNQHEGPRRYIVLRGPDAVSLDTEQREIAEVTRIDRVSVEIERLSCAQRVDAKFKGSQGGLLDDGLLVHLSAEILTDLAVRLVGSLRDSST
jgi:hypothetical protein